MTSFDDNFVKPAFLSGTGSTSRKSGNSKDGFFRRPKPNASSVRPNPSSQPAGTGVSTAKAAPGAFQGQPAGQRQTSENGGRSRRRRGGRRHGGANKGSQAAKPQTVAAQPQTSRLRDLVFEPDKKFAGRSQARTAAMSGDTSGTRPSTGSSDRLQRERKSSAPANGKGKGGVRRGGSRRRQEPQGLAQRSVAPVGKATSLPPAHKKLRIIPIGGNEEVGRNMTIFEYENDIVIVDMGVQWPEEDMPGVDYIVPNANYLKGKEDRIRGVIFTHGHLDHIGAAPILLKQLKYPPIIGRDFTLALIKHKVEDQEKGAASRLKPIRVKSLEDRIRLGQNFEAGFFEVEHSIMDAMGILLKTPSGTVIHMGDWTIANEPLDPHPITYDHLAHLPRPTILMLESLGATKKGLPPSEREVHENFKNLLRSAPGRIIIGTFASQIRRIALLIEYAEELGKRVALEGYSMKMNVEVAKELGYIKAKKETLITVNDIHKYPDKQVMVICTGAQGESNAALARIVTDNHRFIKLQKSDTIIFSSSVIPGNERTIQRLKDNLYRKCDNVIHSDIMDVHIGGHSTAVGIEEMLRQVKPTFFMPVYANHYFLKEAAKIAKRIGFPEQNTYVLDNGGVLEIENNMARTLDKKIDSSFVFIDGLGVGDIGQVVLRDRQMLSQDGMVVVTVILDSKTKKVLGSVQITSRGFIHVKENFDLVNETKKKVIKIIKDNTSRETSIDWDLLRNQIRDVVGQFLFTKTERRPMVLPQVIEV